MYSKEIDQINVHSGGWGVQWYPHVLVSAQTPQGLNSPHLMLTAWKVLGELLVFSPHWKAEEAGLSCQ